MSNSQLFDFARDISDFIKLVDKYEIPIELTELSRLDSYLQYQDEFKVEIKDLVFTVDKKISGTIPYEIEMITIYFSHECSFDKTKNIETHDTICHYSFQLHIKAYNNDAKEYTNWWHLDKNIESDPPKFTHPYYHLQNGGNEIENIDSGGLVMLGAPRIPHPPMDLFLGIHFVFNNFFSSKDFDFVKKILKDETYIDIIIRAQNRMWLPYFNAYAGKKHSDFTISNVFPLYMTHDS
jgi:hypothetical protein